MISSREMMLARSFASSKHLVCLGEKTSHPGLSECVIRVDSSSAMPDAAIHTVGEISGNLNPVLYRVILPNGKIIPAHLSKSLAESKAVFAPPQRVILEMTPYDFDQARILGEAE